MPCCANEALPGDLLFAVVDVRFDKGPPLVLIRYPSARGVGAVLVDRALGPRASLRESVFSLAKCAKPVDRARRGSVGGKADSLMVAQRGQRLDERVVQEPAGRNYPGLEGEPVDQMLDPVAQIRPRLPGVIRQQRRPVRRPAQVGELCLERVPSRYNVRRL
jgi:hypothetical protein